MWARWPMTDPEALLLLGRGYHSEGRPCGKCPKAATEHSTSIWASDHEWGKKKSEVQRTKKEMKKKRERVVRGRREVHLGKLLVIFRPDLYVSRAPACLPSTACFLSVPLGRVSPRHHSTSSLLLLLSLFIWSRHPPLFLFLWISTVTLFPPLFILVQCKISGKE